MIESNPQPVGCFSRNTRYATINTLACTILLACLGLTIYYGIHPSLGLVVKICPNFLMSVELMVASSMGLITFVTLSVQIYRNRFLSSFIGLCLEKSSFLQQQVRFVLHPYGDEKFKASNEIESDSEITQSLSKSYNREVSRVLMTTRDGVSLVGYWAFKSKKAPTVICFHINGSPAGIGDAACWGKFFCLQGYNVLLAEYRGYGLSTGTAGGRNQELEAYLDAEASLKFVLDKEVKREKIIAFGSSLGGAYAAALGYFFNIGKVIIDHSFTSPEAIAASKFKLISEKTFRVSLKAIYHQGMIDAHPDFGVKPLVTDGFNSLDKMKMSPQTALFVIQGREDYLMPVSFGRRFMEEKYKDAPEKQERCLALLDGGHETTAIFHRNDSSCHAQDKLLDFLYENTWPKEDFRVFFKTKD